MSCFTWLSFSSTHLCQQSTLCISTSKLDAALYGSALIHLHINYRFVALRFRILSPENLSGMRFSAFHFQFWCPASSILQFVFSQRCILVSFPMPPSTLPQNTTLLGVVSWAGEVLCYKNKRCNAAFGQKCSFKMWRKCIIFLQSLLTQAFFNVPRVLLCDLKNNELSFCFTDSFLGLWPSPIYFYHYNNFTLLTWQNKI